MSDAPDTPTDLGPIVHVWVLETHADDELTRPTGIYGPYSSLLTLQSDIDGFMAPAKAILFDPNDETHVRLAAHKEALFARLLQPIPQPERPLA